MILQTVHAQMRKVNTMSEASQKISARIRTLPVFLTLFLFFVFFLQLSAQRDNGLLVSMADNLTPVMLLGRFERSSVQSVFIEKRVSKSLNIWLLSSRDDKTETAVLLQWLRQQPEVRAAQYNHILEERNNLPNDPQFNNQWQLNNTGQSGGLPGADIGALAAWDITTGGLTPAGDTIVVAVIDGGIAANHPDLAQNLWYNWADIPNDGIDNDNNGYIDDRRGWNVWTHHDDIEGNATSHGTPVSAIIGARGNNNNGVTGINWKVKLMFVAGGGTEAAILEAYDYVIQTRQRYNETNGQQGAFVVAVNCSWGANYGMPEDAPLWCAAFDSMGQAGILSIAATANIPVDVDVSGDLPTTCPSDYLLAVTSLDRYNNKGSLAAWGAQHIDLGAPGQEVYTAASGNGYGVFYGTSFAAPQVSGAVGMMYAAPCPNLISLAKSNPAAAAIWVKNLILENVTPLASLEGSTVTGGGLQLYQALQQYEDMCSACPSPFYLQSTGQTPQSASLSWIGTSDFQSVKLRWRAVASPSWNVVEQVQSPFQLDNLSPCVSYELEVSGFCTTSGTWSDWSTPYIWMTEGCCEPPASVQISSLHATTCIVSWPQVIAANAYRLRLRPVGASSWELWDTPWTNVPVQGLLPCTDYELQLQTLCDTGSTIFGALYYFQTAGCGSCLDANYCPVSAGQSTYEWIANVSMNDWSNASGNAGSGYQNFSGSLDEILQLSPQTMVNVVITPGFSGMTFKEFYRIYIDFNMDGDFNDPGELVFDPGFAVDEPISGQWTTPDFTALGLTRMRVMMRYRNLNNNFPQACESYDYGQVEDYCVELSGDPTTYTSTQRGEIGMRIYPQPAQDYVHLVFPENICGSWIWTVTDMVGHNIQSGAERMGRFKDIKINTSKWLPGMYIVTVHQDNNMYRGKIWKRE